MNWKPIESAPKDGTEVIVASYEHGVRIASFEMDVPLPVFMDAVGDSFFDATHWMPIPDPPSVDQKPVRRTI